ncbi:glycerol-3-phosphate 1-O-acyltransferase PlsY [Candidatus Latescibacterota bacterium]
MIYYHYFMWILLLVLCAYIIGSIPTSIIAGKMLRGIDVREHGSRNPGATNTLRVLGKKIGITVGLIDIFKGFFAVYFLTDIIPADSYVNTELRMIFAGLAVISGHVWTVFAGFKGGKGVGTAFGVFLALAPASSLVTMVVWCAVTFGTGYVSLGSITGAVVLPASVIAIGLVRGDLSVPLTVISLSVAAIVIVRHRSNISRLLNGEENRFGKRGKQ